MTLATYSATVPAGFVWDDDVYVTANPLLESGAGLRDIWLRPGATPQYYPLVFSTLWLAHHLWANEPLGYHLLNLVLHAACALLLWRLLRRLAVPGAWLAVALFAVHPVLVESVAWVSELKNVQSAALYLLCLLAYFRFAPPEPGSAPSPRDRRFYAAALLLFAAALLTKPAAVGLPLVILLVVWWKRGRLAWADVVRVAPLLVLGAAMGWVTIWAALAPFGCTGSPAGVRQVLHSAFAISASRRRDSAYS